jgi:metallophosphoesterase (TIGR00282 family)
MRILFLGDIVGKCGREAVSNYAKAYKLAHKIDCLIVNGENAAHGFGIRHDICSQLFEAGVDVITLGNHTFDQKDDLQLYDREKRLIRPLNYPKGTPGHGFFVCIISSTCKKILVVNVMGRLYMEQNDDPIAALDDLLRVYRLGNNIDAIIVDIHAEATAEKVAYARYFDGRVTAVVGTHTHVPTADAQILKGGTGLLSDAGMCGDYDSVIGMDDDASIKRFTQKINMFAKMHPATGQATICGVYLEVNNKTGLCEGIKTLRHGGHLKEQQNF